MELEAIMWNEINEAQKAKHLTFACFRSFVECRPKLEGELGRRGTWVSRRGGEEDQNTHTYICITMYNYHNKTPLLLSICAHFKVK
jgi:hypothetical protein